MSYSIVSYCSCVADTQFNPLQIRNRSPHGITDFHVQADHKPGIGSEILAVNLHLSGAGRGFPIDGAQGISGTVFACTRR
ncbi:hypothetical protein D3C75_993620 [compost metagenome]